MSGKAKWGGVKERGNWKGRRKQGSRKETDSAIRRKRERKRITVKSRGVRKEYGNRRDRS